MKQILLFSFCISLFCSLQLHAQITVTGTVMDGIHGGPLPGAMVRVKNKPIGIQTDFDGVYTLVCDSVDVLDVMFLGYDTYSFKASSKNDTITLLENEKQRLRKEKNRKIQDSLLHSSAYINRDTISSDIDFLQIIARNGENSSWMRNKRFVLILYDNRLHKKKNGVVMLNFMEGNTIIEKKFGYFPKDSLKQICSSLNNNMAFNHKHDLIEDDYYVPVLVYDDKGVYLRAKNREKLLENEFSVWRSNSGFGRTVLGGLLMFGEKNSHSNTDSLYQDFLIKNKKLIESDSVIQKMIQLYERK